MLSLKPRVSLHPRGRECPRYIRSSRGTSDKGREVLYPLSYMGIVPVAGFEPASTRSLGEVTLVFTTGRILPTATISFAGERAKRVRGRSSPGTWYLGATSPSRRTESLGRVATLLVVGGEVTLLSHHRRNLSFSCITWSGNMRTRHGDSNPGVPKDTSAEEVSVAFTTDPVKLGWGNQRQRSWSIHSRRNRGLRHPAVLVLPGLQLGDVSN